MIEHGLTPGNQNVVKLGMVYTQNQWQHDLDNTEVENEYDDDTPATRHLTVKASSEIATNTLLWRSKFQIIHQMEIFTDFVLSTNLSGGFVKNLKAE